MVENNNKFDDPLNDIDPVMEDAFSVTESQDSDKITEDSSVQHSLGQADISDIQFPEVQSSFQGSAVETGLFANIPVNVSVELGRSSISLKEIFELTEGAIVQLDRLVGEPLDLVVNGQVVAKGEVIAIDNNFGLRVKTVVSQPNT